MTILLAILLIFVAALAGFVLGSRRGATNPTPKATVTTPLPQVALAAPAEPSEDERAGREKARVIRSRDAEAAALRQELANRDAPLLQLSQFALDREQLYRELAGERAEIARYRQLVIDIENNAPPPILSGSMGPDDLKLIVGIGPVLERMLHTLGITTFRQIARWTERDIAEFDAKLPEFPGRIQRDQWVRQARALHQAKFGEALPEPRGRT